MPFLFALVLFRFHPCPLQILLNLMSAFFHKTGRTCSAPLATNLHPAYCPNYGLDTKIHAFEEKFIRLTIWTSFLPIWSKIFCRFAENANNSTWWRWGWLNLVFLLPVYSQDDSRYMYFQLLVLININSFPTEMITFLSGDQHRSWYCTKCVCGGVLAVWSGKWFRARQISVVSNAGTTGM
jgi:hypothetical protein